MTRSADPPALQYRGQRHRSKKLYWHGTQRSIPPSATLERIRPHFKEVGLTRLANVTGLDRIGIPTVLSVRPNGASLSVDAGKGFTLDAAMASAAMECIERYHAETVELDEIHASYNQVAADHRVIPIERLPLSKHSLFNPRWPERWVLGWDVMNQTEVAVPAQSVTLRRLRFGRAELMPFQGGSNGLSSGNNLCEAVEGGLLELIERDAITCWRVASQRQGRQAPRVRLETISHPLVRDLLQRLEAADIGVALFDCSVDTGVPVAEAYIYDRLTRNLGWYKGYGAHLEPGIAMVRALTEAVQARLIYIAGARDDMFRRQFTSHKQIDDASSITSLERLTPTVDANEQPSLATETFEGDIHVLFDRLRQVGLDQVIVFDLTLPQFPVSAIRVVCPGLEGYVFDNYAPGPRARAFLRRGAA
jgi:ribosomal protein S12 methylthiotransferase accessory factor